MGNGIQEALDLVGDDSMRKLFDFVHMRTQMTDPNKDLLEWVEALRIGSDVGLAIYSYAVNKERICQE